MSSGAGYHQFHDEEGDCTGRHFEVFWVDPEEGREEVEEAGDDMLAPGWYWAECPGKGQPVTGDLHGPYSSGSRAWIEADENVPTSVYLGDNPHGE
jgi:hypothetical protein